MIDITEWKAQRDGESLEEYQMRICEMGRNSGLTWQQIADIINDETGLEFSETKYRRNYKYYTLGNAKVDKYACEIDPDDSVPHLDAETLNKYRQSDEKTNINAMYRRLSREETLKELGTEAARLMNDKKELRVTRPVEFLGGNSAIVQISDWHLGMDFKNAYNEYNVEIAKERIAKLRDEVISLCRINDVTDIHVVNLSDLIAGRIHLQIRLQSRIDVIDQTMLAAELVAEFLTDIANGGFEVHYYDCLDNHSRLEPNKKEAMNLESMARLIPWYLKTRLLNEPIEIHDNEIGSDVITFNCHGYNVIGAHGDKDSPDKLIPKMTLLTHKIYDLALTAHLHTFAVREDGETLVVSNGSLMGTDDLAYDLRLRSKASQNLIILNDQSPAWAIYRIVLN